MNSPEAQSTPSTTGVKLAGESDQLPKTFPSLHLKKLLVPTDFSENSKRALGYAVRLGRRNNSSLILFHAFQVDEFVHELQEDFSVKFNDRFRELFDAARQRSEQGQREGSCDKTQ